MGKVENCLVCDNIVVYKGSWQGCDIAAKRTKTTASQLETFEEAETAMQLRHPNCVQFFGVLCVLLFNLILHKLFFQNDFAHIVTEFMPLGSLQSLLKEKARSFTPQQLTNFSRDACCGMLYLSSMRTEVLLKIHNN